VSGILDAVSPPTTRLSTALADRYRIERELGAGGMATVYLAEDLKHDRKVAIKVLKPELAAVLGAERFVVEIKTTAALSHPHILPLFDSGTVDGYLFYVMPYIQGETIREKLNRETQFGVDEAVRIAREVADALDYAHRHGVIHRDIKPENILLHDGRPMVMDFGIALAVSAAAGGRMTETGLSLGTPHYMSPEQATAEKEITGRSDQYSLASVLYEMLAGQPPHIGGAAQQVIMKILTEPAAPVTSLRKSVTPNVSAALARALEKLPADRFDNAKAFADALANSAFVQRTTTYNTAVPTRAAQSWRTIAIAAVMAAIAGLTALAVVSQRPSPDAPTLRLTLPLPGGSRLLSYNTAAFDIDRSGTRIVYMGLDKDFEGLWIRQLNELIPHPIRGTELGANPIFSGDGRSIAFVAVPLSGVGVNVGQLRVIPTDGGAPATLVRDSVGLHGGDWGEDGYFYFPHLNGRIARVAVTGGPVEIISRIDSGSAERHRYPQLLPGGASLLMQILSGNPSGDGLAVVNLHTGQAKLLIRAFRGRYLDSGHIVYADEDGGLYAVPFDAKRETITGSRVPLADAALVMGGNFARLAISSSGAMVYQRGASSNEQLVWVDRNGGSTPIDSSWRGQFRSPALSPDGSRLAVSIREGSQTRIWVKQLPSGARMMLPSTDRENWRPRFTPNNQRITYLAGAEPRSLRVVARRPDGSDAGETILAAGSLSELDWDPTARTLWVRRGNLVGERDILRFTPGIDSVPNVVLGGTHDEYGPVISPDGRWLAHLSNESGRPQVYVRRVDDPSAGRTQVSIDGASNPVWARSGRELFWRGPEGQKMYVVDVRTNPTFSAGAPRVLFDRTDLVWDFFARSFDVSQDDRRFLMVASDGANAEELVLVLNLGSELRAPP
jgi:eukaryotic-like serine/threonine-protein kinase